MFATMQIVIKQGQESRSVKMSVNYIQRTNLARRRRSSNKRKYEMITSVSIIDNKNLPLGYSHKVEALKNGTKFNFINGINIIIGKNGSGKSTLIKNIASYLLCKNSYYSKLPNFATFGEALKMDDLFDRTALKDGMKIECDYAGVVYNYISCQSKELNYDYTAFSNRFMCGNKSVGERIRYEVYSLFNCAFENKNVQFPIEDIKSKITTSNDYWKDRFTNLLKYYEENRLKIDESEFAYTFLLDEPYRNLDIDNIEDLYKILSYKKEMTQLICVIHNPILIYKLSKLKHINFIELTDGYLEMINKVFNNL